MSFNGFTKRNRSNIMPIASKSPISTRILPVLEHSNLTTCHLVADDFKNGDLIWYDRSPAGNNATVIAGAPKLNLEFGFGTTPEFRDRNYMSCGGAGYGLFKIPNDTWSLRTRRTYELVMEGLETVTARWIFGSDAGQNNSFSLRAGTKQLTAVVRGDSGTWLTTPAVTFTTADYPICMVHIVIDMPQPSIKIYYNGVLLNTTLGPSSNTWTDGVVDSNIYNKTIGLSTGYDGTSTSNVGYNFIYEFLRHEEIFSQKTIKQRCSRFNFMRKALNSRGYP